jgi:hypothetical protein
MFRLIIFLYKIVNQGFIRYTWTTADLPPVFNDKFILGDEWSIYEIYLFQINAWVDVLLQFPKCGVPLYKASSHTSLAHS